ncbi:MAG: hypothetical protein QM820_34025 [Minicystis sp.]
MLEPVVEVSLQELRGKQGFVGVDLIVRHAHRLEVLGEQAVVQHLIGRVLCPSLRQRRIVLGEVMDRERVDRPFHAQPQDGLDVVPLVILQVNLLRGELVRRELHLTVESLEQRVERCVQSTPHRVPILISPS